MSFSDSHKNARGVDSDSGSDSEPATKRSRTQTTESSLVSLSSASDDKTQSIRECPYLYTVNRSLVDFDFAKVCSVTLQSNSVYCCQVCGVFQQGRSRASPAYVHSIDEGHSVFLNLETEEVYCQPENYLVQDPTLSDIKRYLRPVFSQGMIQRLDTDANQLGRTPQGATYQPGIQPIPKVGSSTWMDASQTAIGCILPLRNLFLCRTKNDHPNIVIATMTEFLRRYWFSGLFRPSVSSLQFLQAATAMSKGRFNFDKNSDPVQFFVWIQHQIGTLKPDALECVKMQAIMKQDVHKLVSTTQIMLQPLVLPLMPTFTEKQRVLSSHQVTRIVKDQIKHHVVAQATLLNRYNGLSDIPAPNVNQKTDSSIPLDNTDYVVVKSIPGSMNRTMSINALSEYCVLSIPRREISDTGKVWNTTLVQMQVHCMDLRPCWSKYPLNGHFFLFNKQKADFRASSVTVLLQYIDTLEMYSKEYCTNTQDKLAETFSLAKTTIDKSELVDSLVYILDTFIHDEQTGKYELVCQVDETKEVGSMDFDHIHSYAYIKHLSTGSWYKRDHEAVEHDETTEQQLQVTTAVQRIWKKV